VKLTLDDFDKLHTKKVANIIRKLGAGKTLTKREEEILEQEKTRGASEQNTDANFAGSWDELAKILSDRSGVSITRRAIQEWRRDPRYEDKYPEDRPDGRKDVNAWIVFMRRFGLKAADEVVDPDEIPEERRTIRDWKEYREQLACREAERRIARGDNLLLVATELEVPMGATFVTINSKLAQFPGRAARFMVMKRDEAEAEQTLRDGISVRSGDRRTLQTRQFFRAGSRRFC
jgi:hypothetical protein